MTHYQGVVSSAMFEPMASEGQIKETKAKARAREGSPFAPEFGVFPPEVFDAPLEVVGVAFVDFRQRVCEGGHCKRKKTTGLQLGSINENEL